MAAAVAVACALASAFGGRVARAQDAGSGDASVRVAAAADASAAPPATPPTAPAAPATPAASAGDAGDGMTPAQRQAAAVYDQGLAALNARNYLLAAAFFESADGLVPAVPAAVNAIRAHRGVGDAEHDARAATLALRLLTRYPTDTRATGYAWRTIEELSPRLVRLVVRCQGCDLLVDRRESANEVFVPPGRHSVVARWGTRSAARDLESAAGGTERLELAPPSTSVPPTPGTAAPAPPANTAPAAPAPAPPPATNSARGTSAPQALAPVGPVHPRWRGPRNAVRGSI